jgi:hypothetical protein
MSNSIRESSNYEYQVPSAQLAALLDLALKQDRDLQTLIWEALDEYIQREDQTWTK